MKVYTINGATLWFEAATNFSIDGDILSITGRRGVWIADLRISTLVCWHYDNQEVTAFGFGEAQ